MKPIFYFTFFILLFSFSCKNKKKDNLSKSESALKEINLEPEISIDGLVYEASLNGIINEGDYDETIGVYTENRLGATKKALSMNGLSDYIKVENHKKINPLDGLTISLWYKPISFKGSGNDPIILKPNNTGEAPFVQYLIGVTGNEYPSPKVQGSFKFALSINGKYELLKTKPGLWSPENWYNLTGTYDGNKMQFFVNGKLVNSKTIENGKLDIYDTDLFVGRTLNNKINTPGVYDNIKIYNRGLNKEEIGIISK